MPLPSPTGKRRLLGKSGWQREWQLCQQHWSKLLANPLDKAVGKEAQLCQQIILAKCNQINRMGE
jgi:hypothetical protein